MMKVNKYNKKDEFSYCLGAFPTLELIRKRPELARAILIHEDFFEKDALINECKEKNIAYEIDSRSVNRLANKDNTLVVGLFDKFFDQIEDKNHVVLHEISDMGNLGTIMRTMNAFDMRDLVLVGNVCDVFNPKTVRASMGSIFDMRIKYYDSMEEYLRDYPQRNIYLFMLSKDHKDSIYNLEDAKGKYSLVFGNEGRGLPSVFEDFGRKIFIPQSDRVDSFNLPIAASIGIYEFRRRYEKSNNF